MKKKQKKKVDEGQIKMLLLALGALACIASHFMVHEPTEEQILLVDAEIATQTAEKERLLVIKAKEEVLRLETEESRIIVENELSKYPEDILTETYMMYADGIEKDLDFILDSVNVSVPSLMSKMDIIRHIDGDDVEIPIAAYLTTLAFGWDFTYAQLKSFIEYVRADEYRTVVNNINFAYNATTGQLTGSTVIYKYFIATPGYIFQPADIPMGATGTNNPFGTLIR